MIIDTSYEMLFITARDQLLLDLPHYRQIDALVPGTHEWLELNRIAALATEEAMK